MAIGEGLCPYSSLRLRRPPARVATLVRVVSFMNGMEQWHFEAAR